MKTRQYKRAIIRLLEKSSKPLGVETIRSNCRIGNWNTALKHCLELQYENRIHGVKSSKSWIFWIDPLSPHRSLPSTQERVKPDGG